MLHNLHDTTVLMQAIGHNARAAARELSVAPADQKNLALTSAAAALRANAPAIFAANARDLDAARAAGRPASFIDRLLLDEKRVHAIAQSLDEIAALDDPVGRTLAHWTRPNGLDITRVARPLGVIGIIYESRPNVTADAGSLALKSGNRGDPARRLRKPPLLAGHPSIAYPKACAKPGLPRRQHPACAHDRPRRRRPHADRP